MWLGTSSFAKDYDYIGVEKCGKCHKKEKKGAQLKKWQDGPHAKAFKTLGTDSAKLVAKKAGVTGDPQKAPECLKCHVTGYGLPAARFGEKFKAENGVGCESCHGPGSAYKKKKIMKDHDKSVANGLVEITEKTCTECHNDKSPTFKDFNYEERVKDIAHPVPEGAKGGDDEEEE
ncbi:MAG: ammonia-forming cytochrome c nitrite reductase subunit c552 [Fibrobacteria bacterium]|nr:ammonia-forming cytochrome c nitrite reductase subunit c552 [Fibrobacteria bacterium]